MGPALTKAVHRLAELKLVPGAPFQISVNKYVDGTHAMVVGSRVLLFPRRSR